MKGFAIFLMCFLVLFLAVSMASAQACVCQGTYTLYQTHTGNLILQPVHLPKDEPQFMSRRPLVRAVGSVCHSRR